MSSRLFQRVREEQGLAYSIYNYTDFYRDTGMLATSFSSSSSNCNRALAIVAEEYDRLRSGELDEQELESKQGAARQFGGAGHGVDAQPDAPPRTDRDGFRPIRAAARGRGRNRGDHAWKTWFGWPGSFLDPARQTVVGYGPLARMEWPVA